MAPSPAVLVMLAPRREYKAAIAVPSRTTWRHALTVPALLAVLLGIITSVAATGRVTASLVISQTLAWSFVPILQLLNAIAFVGFIRNRSISVARGVELLFAGHGPWSLWLIGVAAVLTVSPNYVKLLATAIVPAAWTSWIIAGFAREVLGLSKARARLQALAHQLVTLLLILLYVEWATALSVRLSAAIGS